MHTLTGLAHDRMSHVAYDPKANEEAIRHRSQKLIAFQKTLKPPPIFGDEEGELLVVGWGSTRGGIEEAVERVRADGYRVGAMHLRFLQPLAPGIKAAMQNFERVMTVENNWSDRRTDELVDEDNRRYSNLAWLLRARCLVDVDCWGELGGRPLKPGAIERAIRERLGPEGR
jgi:2-oxoglutarate ferredoxin oxidoreductase subunit alpha